MSQSILFTPLKLSSSLTLADRLIVSPMCQYSAVDGHPNDWHFVHLGSMATHGCSTIIVEATGITDNGRITPGCTGIWSDEHIQSHKRIVDFVKTHKAAIGIQIGHAGRKASSKKPWLTTGQHTIVAGEKEGGWPNDVWAPSPIPWDEKAAVPKELTVEKIKSFVKAFGDAAERAVKAGYMFIEIHAAHGYLLHEFFSPITNKRKDVYGGSFENRTRIAREIAEEIRKRVGPDFTLGIRISCTDWIEGGWNPQDAAMLVYQLTEAPYNLNFIDCSSGGIHPDQKFPNPIPLGYQVRFAQVVKKKVGSRAAVFTVGLIVDPYQAEDILKETGLDAVMLARQILREPSFPYRASQLLGCKPYYPDPYGYALARNPPEYVRKDSQKKNAPTKSGSKWLIPALAVGSLAAGAALGYFLGQKKN